MLLLEIFREVVEQESSAKLLLVGFGPLERILREKVRDMGLSEAVTFYDQAADVSELLRRADVFLLPSYYEGLPIVALESQLAGLPIVASTAVTREIDIGLAVFVSLNQSARTWAAKTIEAAHSLRGAEVSVAAAEKFDIKNVAMQWVEMYTSVTSG